MKNPDELDDLPVPQARPDFQQRLEESLLARMKEKQEKKMDTTLRLKNNRFVPIMPLIAAALTLFMVVSLFSLMSRQPPPLNNIDTGILQPTITVTPITQIVVASHFIERGHLITADDLIYREWSDQFMPLSAILNTQVAIGLYALTDISHGVPVQWNMIDTSAPTIISINPAQAVDVVVAAQPIMEGQFISREMLVVRSRPMDSLPPRYFTSIDALIGRTAWENIYHDQVINLMIVSDNTPINLSPVVTTEKLILRGQQLTPDMLKVTMWSHDDIPENAFTTIDEVVGQVALNDIPAHFPVITELVTQNLSDLGLGGETGAITPSDTVRITIPLADLTIEPIQPGRYIDVYRAESGSGVMVVDRPEGEVTLLAQNALVVYQGEDPQTGENIISLSVTSQDAVSLNSAINDQLPLVLVKVAGGTYDLGGGISSQDISILPPGTRAVAIPVADDTLTEFQPGDRVDVYERISCAETETKALRAEDVMVLYVGQMPTEEQIFSNVPILSSDIPAGQSVIIIAAPPLEAISLGSRGIAGGILTVIPHQVNTVGIFLPMDLLTLSTLSTPRIGDRVNIIVQLLYVDVDENMTPTSEPKATMNHLTANARVSNIDMENGITVVVSPEDAAKLQYFVESSVPMMLIP